MPLCYLGIFGLRSLRRPGCHGLVFLACPLPRGEAEGPSSRFARTVRSAVSPVDGASDGKGERASMAMVPKESKCRPVSTRHPRFSRTSTRNSQSSEITPKSLKPAHPLTRNVPVHANFRSCFARRTAPGSPSEPQSLGIRFLKSPSRPRLCYPCSPTPCGGGLVQFAH